MFYSFHPTNILFSAYMHIIKPQFYTYRIIQYDKKL